MNDATGKRVVGAVGRLHEAGRVAPERLSCGRESGTVGAVCLPTRAGPEKRKPT